LDEKEELENLKRLLFKAVKGEGDKMLVEIITDYMEGFCKIKHDCFAETIKVGFEEVKKLITDNHLDTTNNIDQIKRELGLNGFCKKG
jgi:hypothetical protein